MRNQPKAKIEDKKETPAPVADKTITQQTVSIFLQAGPEPDKQGLGAVFPRITHKSGGREIAVQLFTERLLVSRAITNGDQLTLRFLGSLLFVEFLVKWNESREISAIRDSITNRLGGPWSFHANWTFLTSELARNDLTASLEKTGIFASPIPLKPGEQPAIYTAFELCLHECQFERVQV